MAHCNSSMSHDDALNHGDLNYSLVAPSEPSLGPNQGKFIHSVPPSIPMLSQTRPSSFGPGQFGLNQKMMADSKPALFAPYRPQTPTEFVLPVQNQVPSNGFLNISGFKEVFRSSHDQFLTARSTKNRFFSPFNDKSTQEYPKNQPNFIPINNNTPFENKTIPEKKPSAFHAGKGKRSAVPCPRPLSAYIPETGVFISSLHNQNPSHLQNNHAHYPQNPTGYGLDNDFGMIRSLPRGQFEPYQCPRCLETFYSSQSFAAHASWHYRFETEQQKQKRRLAKCILKNPKKHRTVETSPEASQPQPILVREGKYGSVYRLLRQTQEEEDAYLWAMNALKSTMDEMMEKQREGLAATATGGTVFNAEQVKQEAADADEKPYPCNTKIEKLN